MKALRVLVMTSLLSLGLGTLALAAGPNPNCPDADNDGICNCQDPDYAPGTYCNPDCPDADGDGICNGEDPDYIPPDGGGIRDRVRDRLQSPTHLRTRDQIHRIILYLGFSL